MEYGIMEARSLLLRRVLGIPSLQHAEFFAFVMMQEIRIYITLIIADLHVDG
jgi:hypothetical protein